MLDKIKKALGEELSSQVEEAMKTANIELAVLNDATVVPIKKFRDIETKFKTSETTNSTLKGDMESLKNTNADNDKDELSQKEINEQLRKDFEDYKTSAESDKVNSRNSRAYEKALNGANINKDALDLMVSSANYEKIMGEDGTVNQDFINDLVNSKPSLFGVEQMNSQQTKNTQTKEKPKYTHEEMKNMTPSEVRANMKDIKASLSQ